MTAPKSKISPSAERECITVGDARLIAHELVAQATAAIDAIDDSGPTQTHRLERIAADLRVTAAALNAWATKVAMRRDANKKDCKTSSKSAFSGCGSGMISVSDRPHG